ncbi:MAG: hypothetical protein JWN64_782 [Parcubacteria group bacterium]|nr:hypothetical protein [Parcubacteria group bacterium]
MEKHHLPTWHHKDLAERSTGERVADAVASYMGSWKFIILQSVLVILWIFLNMAAFSFHWDPWPFILLNLLFSTQAAYAAPIIMMAQNRAADRDRQQALADYQTNCEAKLEIESIQKELARIENDKLDKILNLLENK